MQLPTEVVQAEILDWWEGERERIAQIMPDRMPALFYNVDKVIDDMSVADFLKRGRFVANKVEPLVADWIERTYKELTHEIDESFRASAYKTEGGDAYQKWSYGDMATAGAAIAVSAAPVAGIPFFAGGMTTAGTVVLWFTIGGGNLIPAAVVALAGSAVLLAAGPGVRSKAITRLKSKLKASLHDAITTRVLGVADGTKLVSLKHVLFGELQGVALKRMEMAK